MSKELIVAAGRHETRVAILEDDQLVEVFHEREKEYSLAGSIHKGRVTRVLPGMQSAFVDIGLERDAFLYVSDFFEDTDEYDAVVSTAEDKVLKLEKNGGSSLAGETRAMAAPATAETAAAEEAPAADGQAPREGRNDHEGRREHGRRGRRGRRRGGRGGGGIPESKYFTPGAERQGGSAEARTEQPEEEPEESVGLAESQPVSGSQPYERLVLPGESLAKYSAGPAESAEPEPVAAAEAEDVEPAIPVDHHLAGLTWATPAPIIGAASEDGPVVEAIAEAQFVRPDLIPTPDAPAETLSPEDEEQILAAAEAVEAIQEEADEIAIGVPALGIDEEVEEIDRDEEPAEAEAAAESEGEPESPAEVATDEESPEPARTPVSLTATLREQGHRYPHRVSRRSRRRGGRNRGGEDRGPRTEGGQQNAAEGTAATTEGIADADGAAIDAALTAPENGQAVLVEEKSPALREERREERRGDRERGRDRGRGREGRREGRERDADRERPVLPSISDLLKEGQEIIVQISKEPLGQKGARITSHIALPGRFVVYMPTVDHAGVSRKIPSEEERHRLKKVLQTHRQGIPGGYICRTAAEGKSEEELRSDMHFLYNLWLDMRQKAEKKPAPVLLHHDLDLVQRILRDQLTTSFKTIWVDNEEHYESILRFVERFQPALVGRVKLYTRDNPIFDEFGITAELEKALRPKVWLKSGGYIVINQTEALVAIDINTGKYVGKSNRLEDTIVKINTDAIKEIVRQIRLRDLGGIIVVDFIDMDERKNRQKVMAALEEAMRVDRAPYKILQFNDFGLVAITRKRVKQSLERTLCAPCSYCEGAGYIKSPQTVITEILSEAQRMHRALAGEKGNVVLRVNPEVAKMLKSNHNSYLQEVEEILGKTVLVKSDPLLHQTKFDLA
ncbi:MAG TPA: Rne/Rng family ribonuclease [Bryobacteraceae bacterium]|nr:Rne/Rng family ribonuclease [Bryobacteraceae bacterium]